MVFAVGARDGLTAGQRVIFGIRPEHLLLGKGGFALTVAVIEPTGSETHVISHFGTQDVVAVFRERHSFAIGQQISLYPEAEHVVLFDATSGARIGQGRNYRQMKGYAMLKGIDPRLNAEVLYALRSMGHGDVLILADSNFPSDSIAGETVLGGCCGWTT